MAAGFADIFVQMAILFAVGAAGYAAKRLRLMDEDFDKKLSKLILNISLPAMILASVLTAESLPSPSQVLWTMAVACLSYVVLIAVGFGRDGGAARSARQPRRVPVHAGVRQHGFSGISGDHGHIRRAGGHFGHHLQPGVQLPGVHRGRVVSGAGQRIRREGEDGAEGVPLALHRQLRGGARPHVRQRPRRARRGRGAGHAGVAHHARRHDDHRLVAGQHAGARADRRASACGGRAGAPGCLAAAHMACVPLLRGRPAASGRARGHIGHAGCHQRHHAELPVRRRRPHHGAGHLPHHGVLAGDHSVARRVFG